jgi:hypothetical protein
MVGATVGKSQPHTLAWADQGAGRLEKQPLLRYRTRIAPAEYLALAVRLGYVVAVVGRRADDRGWRGNRAEELHLADRKGGAALGCGEDGGLQPVEVGDQRIALRRERIGRLGQSFERNARVTDTVALDEPQAIVVEPAYPRPVLPPLTPAPK